MLEKLANSLGRNDEVPNIELADLLAETGDHEGIQEIARGMMDNDRAIANDCIKVMYELAERRPDLTVEYASDYIKLLSSKNNRLVWGAMTAIAQIADRCAEEIFTKINLLKKAYENGSVITVDNSITVFAKLCNAGSEYEKEIFPFLLEHLATCRPKEVAQHAERMAVCINEHNFEAFEETIMRRYDILTVSQQKRVKRLLSTKKYSKA